MSAVREIPCPACGYDLRGRINEDRVICPECGTGHDSIALQARLVTQWRRWPTLVLPLFSALSTVAIIVLTGFNHALQEALMPPIMLAGGTITLGLCIYLVVAVHRFLGGEPGKELQAHGRPSRARVLWLAFAMLIANVALFFVAIFVLIAVTIMYYGHS